MKILFTLLLSFSFMASAKTLNTSFTNSHGATAGATIELPENSKLGVVFIHGSGPADRNLTVKDKFKGQTFKMFKTLALSFKKSQIASLRYDKNGIQLVKDEKNILPGYYNNTKQSLEQDAILAVDHFRKKTGIQNVILFGISEGTSIAPSIANTVNAHGIILASALARNLRDTLYYQLYQRNLDIFQNHVDTNKDQIISKKEFEAAQGYIHFPFDKADENNNRQLELFEIKSYLLEYHLKNMEAILQSPSSPWLKSYFDSTTPNHKVVSRFKGPILLLQGELDIQTPVEEAYVFKNHLKLTRHPNYTVKVYPRLGHLLSANQGPKNLIPSKGPLDSTVHADLLQWLKHQ